LNLVCIYRATLAAVAVTFEEAYGVRARAAATTAEEAKRSGD